VLHKKHRLIALSAQILGQLALGKIGLVHSSLRDGQSRSIELRLNA
jgi:hypothetical protein